MALAASSIFLSPALSSVGSMASRSVSTVPTDSDVTVAMAE